MSKPRKTLTLEQALQIIPDQDVIHTFRIVGDQPLGAFMTRKEVIELIKKHGVELAGDMGRQANHGLCVQKKKEFIYIENRRATNAESASKGTDNKGT